MDLLAGYVSDGDLEGQTDVPEPLKSKQDDAGSAEEGIGGGTALFSKLPAPATGQTVLFSGIPKPAPKKRKVALGGSGGGFKAMDYGDVGDLPDDDYVPKIKKKAVVVEADQTIGELLPAPKHAPAKKKETDYGFGAPKQQPSTTNKPTINAAPEFDAPVIAANEMYRVDKARPYVDPSVYAEAGYEIQYPEHAGPSHVHQRSSDPAQAYLEATMEAKRARGSEADALAAVSGVQFKEIRADEVRYMNPAQRAEVNALREALGPDYEQRLKAEASKVGNVSKLAKRRHQIGSLFVAAKAQELEDIEKKATGMKSKAHTARKYGW